MQSHFLLYYFQDIFNESSISTNFDPPTLIQNLKHLEMIFNTQSENAFDILGRLFSCILTYFLVTNGMCWRLLCFEHSYYVFLCLIPTLVVNPRIVSWHRRCLNNQVAMIYWNLRIFFNLLSLSSLKDHCFAHFWSW